MERLEDRTLLAASLMLSGTQALVPGTNYNTSDPVYPGSPVTDYGRDQVEMSLAVDPSNPLNVVGISHRIDREVLTPTGSPTKPEIDILFSEDGGVTWGRTIIGPGPDTQISDGTYPNGTPRIVNVIDDDYGVMRRGDPSIEFDAQGRLYIAYVVRLEDLTGNTHIVFGKSLDRGRTFEFETIDSQPTDLDKLHIATGPDPANLQNQAVYVAYAKRISSNTFHTMIAGSYDHGENFTIDTVTTLSSIIADPAVGPDGQVYVAWKRIGAAEIQIAVDTDRLNFGSGFSPPQTVASGPEVTSNIGNWPVLEQLTFIRSRWIW